MLVEGGRFKAVILRLLTGCLGKTVDSGCSSLSLKN